jgi:hypothetical protein
MFDPTKPVQTRDGRKARIICTDRENVEYPIVALIASAGGEEIAATFTDDGRFYYAGREDDDDLVNVPETTERSFAVYPSSEGGSVSEFTEEEVGRLSRDTCRPLLKMTFVDGKYRSCEVLAA